MFQTVTLKYICKAALQQSHHGKCFTDTIEWFTMHSIHSHTQHTKSACNVSIGEVKYKKMKCSVSYKIKQESKIQHVMCMSLCNRLEKFWDEGHWPHISAARHWCVRCRGLMGFFGHSGVKHSCQQPSTSPRKDTDVRNELTWWERGTPFQSKSPIQEERIPNSEK